MGNRRAFLHLSALVGASFALPPAVWWGRRQRSSLRVAYSDLIQKDMLEQIKRDFLGPIEGLTGRRVEVISVPNDLLFHKRKVLAGFDGYLTSPTFHRALPTEHLFFGPMPFGLERSEKMAWMKSTAGEKLQASYFSRFGLHPQAVALGSDRLGFFSRKKIESAPDLIGESIAIRDARSVWFSAEGMKPTRVEPFDQPEALLQRVIGISEPASPDVSLYASEVLASSGESWVFTEFPGIRTAPVLFFLWNEALYKGMGSEQQSQLRSLGAKCLDQVSEVWEQRQLSAFKEISAKHEICQLPERLIERFRKHALREQKALIERSPLAALLARASGLRPIV